MPLCRHLSNSVAAKASPVDGAPGRLRGADRPHPPLSSPRRRHPSHPNGARVDPRSCRVSNSVCGQTCARPARRSCCERALERTEPCAPAPDPRHRARRGGYLVRRATRSRRVAAREAVVRGVRPQIRRHEMRLQADPRFARRVPENQDLHPSQALNGPRTRSPADRPFDPAGATGLEPATPGFGDRCATNCATPLGCEECSVAS